MAENFKIEIPQATLDDLRERLAKTRWTDQIEGAGWDYGTNLNYLKELCAYWQNDFDWRRQEAELNNFNHFRAEIDGFGSAFYFDRMRAWRESDSVVAHTRFSRFFRADAENYSAAGRGK